MADVIVFKGEPRHRRDAALPPSEARILFFTGVRYERDVEPGELVPRGRANVQAARTSGTDQDRDERLKA